MKANETNLLNFLQGTKQFTIPIYQRTYSWTRRECQQLWNDIIRIAQDQSTSAHFVGSVVYIEKGIYQVSSVPQLLVIDGQQRLTTLSLVLSALAKAIDTSNSDFEMTRRKIYNYYLLNNDEDGNLRYKLMLTQGDYQTYVHLIDEKNSPERLSPRLVENYQYFEEQIRRSNLTLDKIYEGIRKLVMIDVSLDRNYDNPQLIFESLNSTGLALSQADLIRNYILMGLDPKDQTQLYQDYWYPMEQSFGHREYTIQFDRFMRDYLTIQNSGTIPNISEVYSVFKSFAYVKTLSGNTVQDIVADIYKFSRYFVNIALLKESDETIRRVLADIRELKVEVANPFLMEVYDDFQNGLLSRGEFISILNLVGSYVFRRAIVGIPTNSLNKTFANLAREIQKDNYFESVQMAFYIKDSYKRFPKDDEFRQQFMEKDVYNFPRRMYMLRKLENHRRKEKAIVEDYTVEHILPQNPNLSITWQNELGVNWKSIQSRYLHTIGNLTLTGYNSELSDKPFLQKRDAIGGFSDSPLRLNRSLAKLPSWNEEQIQQRANALAQLATEIWQMPQVSTEMAQKYSQPSYTQQNFIDVLDGAEYLQQLGMASLFEALRRRILNLDPSIREEIKKKYIAYKTTTNFVDIVPQKNRLRLSLNVTYEEIDDPKGLCTDITNVSRWGNGDVEVKLSSIDELDDVMYLIHQAFEEHSEEVN